MLKHRVTQSLAGEKYFISPLTSRYHQYILAEDNQYFHLLVYIEALLMSPHSR